MLQTAISPVVLVILDGWGYSLEKNYNPIKMAKTPVMDCLWEVYPKTLIETSGKYVGLPEGQMGNSEVGHLNLGAGRIVPQELVRISNTIDDKSFYNNEVLISLYEKVKSCQKKLHLIGLCSEGGVHSHLDHLLELLNLAKQRELTDVCIHAITDGRDTKKNDGIKSINKIYQHTEKIGLGRISTISGRYYAMDRDQRWERIKLAYDTITQDVLKDKCSALDVLKNSYKENKTDEFIIPTRVDSGAIEDGDGVIFFNFRSDRTRQLCSALIDNNFKNFNRKLITPLEVVTFTKYDDQFSAKVAFKSENLHSTLGEVISNNGLKQLRIAETEKYPHITYFFNGGIEQPFKGERRELIQSPMVSTYDEAPEMSAKKVTDRACLEIEKGIYSLIVINYANPDMVGHTGNIEATVEAIETVDNCLGVLLSSISKVGGTTLITADHGNAETMKDNNNNILTSHTLNPVPFILVEGEKRKITGYGGNVILRGDSKLSDIAPTILQILGIQQPSEMTGKSCFQNTIETDRNLINYPS
ncbi:2,3-bisphosphoglycerate-independent phosphoglycerate mutase [Candidatus Atelocyanobacterium thalassae]|uniref:2,3-bisphosphoglycerate-independent phosphoglycerate mutase n=1 Tax=cyanobacterium endosymbiont of Braarudosphaera bigelowii TaxID=1285375 RepID=A0ABN6K2Q3_9CHRO|nr:2,3-bisphosphoglycerate-independent phosphoglycerate mutase [Candidatus Atelocyanobacterium thalassa]BDA39530.1 2,3-bisphosphoglycerate-independent phosphoglycerate mutase [cyanobacterium endosymbiont of Braarudosphaera bigelowii]